MEKQNYDSDKNCKLEQKENITEWTEQSLKTSIENILVDGFNIENKQGYNSLKMLLEKHNIISLCWYQDIIDGYKIGERTNQYQFSLSYNKDDWVVYVYPASNSWFSSQCGYIQDGKYYESINIFNIDIANNNSSILPIEVCEDNTVVEDVDENELLRQDNNKLRTQIQELQNQVNTQQCPIIEEVTEEEQVNQNVLNPINHNEWDINVVVHEQINNTVDVQNIIPQDKDYIVKSWDNLWNIIKKYYGLTSNRDIANYVNKLVKYNLAHNTDNRNIADDNTPDGIFGDKIYVGQKIILAKELTFRNKTISLINKET